MFASMPDVWEAMRQAGLPVKGRLEDLLGQTDVVVDCTPKKVAARNRALYAANHVTPRPSAGDVPCGLCRSSRVARSTN